ncbi:hypothetical protein BT67DRAFT_376532 [Trichocladium antarcticum]|uniref:Survival Motor Neuron Gemin2-binding domain-containing protein n=1 Tax=Trichocladium antarcticum TaxID=1450529 RepID=A0AAN6UMF3_9PEZI|nr:hypothetical protein BT67DRAFT_376532 [Trichocladium antarcticum]
MESAKHEEIWDDSALVDSWNQALDEYKKYHSIHARGGTVDDLPGDMYAPAIPNTRETTPRAGTLGHSEPIGQGIDQAEEGEVDETVPMAESDETSHPTIPDPQGSVDAKKQGDTVAAIRPAAFPPGPQMLLGTVQDEELKKLLMSWYYAGYYTGLYEGKQQGLQQAEQARKTS